MAKRTTTGMTSQLGSESRRSSGCGRKGIILRVLTPLAVMLTIVLLTSSVTAAEEETLRIKSVQVSVWAEYDDPRILVIYQGEFNDIPAFPQPVEFLAPSGAEINQVCALTKPANEHLCQLYETVEGEDSLAISYTLPIPTFFLEYYYPGITVGTDERAFTYEFQSPYPIDELEIEVQQPLRSSHFSLFPTQDRITSDGLGFNYYHYSFDDVAAGEVITIGASYTKTDRDPSMSGNQGQQGGAGSSAVPIVLGVIAVAVMGTVGWFALLRHRRPTSRATAAAGRAGRATAVESKVHVPKGKPAGGKVSFCSNCGRKLEQIDNFCPGCGTGRKKTS